MLLITLPHFAIMAEHGPIKLLAAIYCHSGILVASSGLIVVRMLSNEEIMSKNFLENLSKAQGRSEFVIVVNADIRGFSAFSVVNEAPNIAMFIKRFYLQMINIYFPNATFVKPTGDGLLMIFTYNEDDLIEASKSVLTYCYKCLKDFPSFCKNDPMINFEVPALIGFGVARGTACCLYSGDEILDYSGHLLNLCSRLMELARPSGIVIDGSYVKSVIPKGLRKLFKEQNVYVRSIAEDTPTNVFYLDGYVEIPEFYLSPLLSEKWLSVNKESTVREIKKIHTNTITFRLPDKPKSHEKVRVIMIYAKKGLAEPFEAVLPHQYSEHNPNSDVIVSAQEVLALITRNKLSGTTKVKFRLDYVPKPLKRA